MRILFLIICLALASCATPLVAVKAVCPPVKAYTPEEQKELAAEIASLQPGSALFGMVTDYSALRDASRACAK